MVRSTTDSSPLPLDRQILRLSHLADQIREAINFDHAPGCEEALDDLAQLAGALTRISRHAARLVEERDNLLALAGISQVVNSTLKLDDVLRIVMDTIVRLTGAERGFLMLRDDQGQLTIRVARNWEQETLNASEFAISRTVVNQVIAEIRPVLTTNAQQDPRFDSQESVITLNLRSILCVPLKVRDELIGVIYADNRVRTGLFTETERNLLAAFANQAAVAIENARLYESIQQTLQEVTELKNLMDDVFASIASGVITANPDNQITLSNQAAETILGKSKPELIGSNLEQVAILSDARLARALAEVQRTNRQIVGLELTHPSSQKPNLALSFNLSPLKDANQTTRGVAIVLEDLTETRRLESLSHLFERMVSPAVIEQLNPDELQLGGKRTEITTLFADIRGFTSFSERADPEVLVTVLNRYLGAATEAVLAEEGTLDKFMGDAVLALFNAPFRQPDHALRAVRVALQMRNSIQKLREGLPEQFRLAFGIGVNSGEAILGLIGTEKRLEYTAIGDCVNTAKRLQENAEMDQILISATVYAQVHGHVTVRPVKPVQAKGKTEPVQVYELIGLV
jgi:PAS domain S-box-containing protein